MNGPLYKNTDPGDGTVVNVSFWSCLAAPRPDEKESGELLTREGTDKLKLVTAADRAGQWVPEGGEGEASSPLSHSPKPCGQACLLLQESGNQYCLQARGLSRYRAQVCTCGGFLPPPRAHVPGPFV